MINRKDGKMEKVKELIKEYEKLTEETLKKSNHNIVDLREEKYYYVKDGELIEENKEPRILNWGLMRDGVYITSNDIESDKTGPVMCLEDILEDEVEDNFYLQDKHLEKITWKEEE